MLHDCHYDLVGIALICSNLIERRQKLIIWGSLWYPRQTKQTKGKSTDMATSIATKVSKLKTIIEKHPDASKIVLLANEEVLFWIYHDTSFLPPIVHKNKTKDTEAYSVLENAWGRKTAKLRRPDLKPKSQWTTTFGQHICEELCILQGKNVSAPKKKQGMQPDRETDDAIIEVKTQTYYTDGTAGEKILGCPFKYCEVPKLYNKPLKILCIGCAESLSKNTYGNLDGPKVSDTKRMVLDFYKNTLNIEFIAATDILDEIIVHNDLSNLAL
jgi:hypothetical protein